MLQTFLGQTSRSFLHTLLSWLLDGSCHTRCAPPCALCWQLTAWTAAIIYLPVMSYFVLLIAVQLNWFIFSAILWVRPVLDRQDLCQTSAKPEPNSLVSDPWHLPTEAKPEAFSSEYSGVKSSELEVLYEVKVWKTWTEIGYFVKCLRHYRDWLTINSDHWLRLLFLLWVAVFGWHLLLVMILMVKTAWFDCDTLTKFLEIE